MDLKLAGKPVIVTGGGSGIGAAISCCPSAPATPPVNACSSMAATRTWTAP
jgi:hypothetical protein